MKRSYILFQVILIVVGLTFCSCNVEKNAQRNGVKIDKVVEQSAEEVMRGMDVQLQAAIDYLQGVNI